MVATICLLTCALATAPPEVRADWQLAPRLSRGQELVYSGSFKEETLGKAVQHSRTYQLESRVFVLYISPQGSDVALFTVVRMRRPGQLPGTGPDQPASVQLELAKVDPQGHVTAAGGVPLAVALEGPTGLECGAFVPARRGRLEQGQTWEVPEEARPPRTWKVVGNESVQGTPCLKLTGIQQSADWDHPRGDSTAWRRLDTVWLEPVLGIAFRFERRIERREPARREPTHRSLTAYSLDNRMVYPGLLADDRRHEILYAAELADKMNPFLRAPEKVGPRYFEDALGRIAQYMESQPATPYREALTHLQRRLEAARRGEAPPAPSERASAGSVVAVGQPAPDFVVPDLDHRESARLRRFLGRPVLLVFYSPTSRYAPEILHFAQSLSDAHRDTVTVIGLTVSEDFAFVRKQRDELRVTFALLSGQGLRLTYAVEATPKFVLLDAKGIVRGAYVGWGREVPALVTEELKRWKGSTDE